MNSALSKLGWLLLSIAGAFCLGVVALSRGEQIDALWLLAASVCVYLVAYRFYGLFVANKAMQVDPTRITPAVKHNDGLDYVPTDKWTLYGAHFSAIAGAGPLVGPVLAAQMGYLPGTLWILAGAVFAGAVQDMMVLYMSVRRDAKSLGDMIKLEMGPFTGVVVSIGILAILMIIIAALALIVVKALSNSPWGLFTVAMTIPTAFFMGIYTRYLRPGRVGEVSVIGFVLLMASIIYGQEVAQVGHPLRDFFDYDAPTLAIILIVYGFFAAIVPVWLLMAPRGLLSTFLKIGVIVLLAIGILFVNPTFEMPAVTQFIDGTGPVFAGKLFPFLFITIACGAISGFHATVSSGTTSKMLSGEGELALIGYGGMLMESFVAMMALITATIIHPGVFFAMNSAESAYATPTLMAEAAAQPDMAELIKRASENPTIKPEDVEKIATMAKAASIYTEKLLEVDGKLPEGVMNAEGKVYTHLEPQELLQWAKDVGEPSIMSRTGGAPTLAVGISYILAQMTSGFTDGDNSALMSFWYHFAIVFEALFILTTVDAGTRTGRYMIHDLVGMVIPPMKRTDSTVATLIATVGCVGIWGYFLWNGVVDPNGGVKTLWPLFGISNQMLAGIALMFCSVVLFKMKRDKYAWIPLIPGAFVTLCTLVAGFQKILPNMPVNVSFVAKYLQLAEQAQTATDEALAGIQLEQTIQLVDAVLTGVFMLLVVVMIISTIRAIMVARSNPNPTAMEWDHGRIDANAQKA